jgi:hypothetical protein
LAKGRVVVKRVHVGGGKVIVMIDRETLDVVGTIA